MSKRQKAQGLVEFALILPLLLAVLMACIDFGWVVFNYVQLNNGLREGLRYGSVAGFNATNQYRDCASIYGRIKSTAPWARIQDSDIVVYYDNGYSTGPSDAANVSGTCTLPGPYAGTLTNGQRIVIQVNPTVGFMTPFFRTLWPGGLQFTFRGGRTIYPTGVSE